MFITFEHSSVTPCSLHLINGLWRFVFKMWHHTMRHHPICYKYWCFEDPSLWKCWQTIPVHKSLVCVCRTALLCIPEDGKVHHLWCESLKCHEHHKIKPSLFTALWTNQLCLIYLQCFRMLGQYQGVHYNVTVGRLSITSQPYCHNHGKTPDWQMIQNRCQHEANCQLLATDVSVLLVTVWSVVCTICCLLVIVWSVVCTICCSSARLWLPYFYIVVCSVWLNCVWSGIWLAECCTKCIQH
jgi:hypothetical protein